MDEHRVYNEARKDDFVLLETGEKIIKIVESALLASRGQASGCPAGSFQPGC